MFRLFSCDLTAFYLLCNCSMEASEITSAMSWFEFRIDFFTFLPTLDRLWGDDFLFWRYLGGYLGDEYFEWDERGEFAELILDPTEEAAAKDWLIVYSTGFCLILFAYLDEGEGESGGCGLLFPNYSLILFARAPCNFSTKNWFKSI